MDGGSRAEEGQGRKEEQRMRWMREVKRSDSKVLLTSVPAERWQCSFLAIVRGQTL